ncbi:hypothetical protein [Vibrio jasicida]|uniref:hypothetical protein n=1 Tax=Vibrio jasicida TaxID=766224 RepID=UPI000ADF826D|nr:hypothetical protein [Vibrio jasicida]
MSQYLIEPEVPGGFGKNTLGRFDVHPPIVEKLHLEFDGWQGDDLLEAFPCFLVSEHLATALVASKCYPTSSKAFSQRCKYREGRYLPYFTP